MARAEGVQDVPVVLAALVGVANEKRYRGAGGDAFIYPRQYLHRVRLVALRDVARRARPAPIQFDLDVGLAEAQPGRAAVDDAADRHAVGLAEIGDAKEFAEGAA